MHRFRFQLDPLLNARRLAERNRQRAVAAVNRERVGLEAALRTQQENIAQGKLRLRSGLIGTINSQSLRMHAAASLGVMRKAQRIVLELAGVHKRLEAARIELMRAVKSRRAIEIIRERRFDEWNAALNRIETNELDELAVIAAARQDAALASSHAASRNPEPTS